MHLFIDESGDLGFNIFFDKVASNKAQEQRLSFLMSSRFGMKHGHVVKVWFVRSQDEKSIQVADYVSWAILRKYERGDDSYYGLISSRVTKKAPRFDRPPSGDPTQGGLTSLPPW